MEDKGRLGAPGLGTVALTAVPAVVWGSTYAVTQLWLPPDRPFFAAAARVLPAGLLLLLWVRRLPRGRWWGRSLALGALNHGIFFALLYVGAYRLPSGLGSTLTAISPLIVMATAFLVLRERQPWVTVAAAVASSPRPGSSSPVACCSSPSRRSPRVHRLRSTGRRSPPCSTSGSSGRPSGTCCGSAV